MTENARSKTILVGANDPLPEGAFWLDGDGFSIYAARQPRSTWQEHAHDRVQVTVGLEPAHIYAEWRAAGALRQKKEFIGNAVSVIPAGEPHRTLWQRRAALVHVYLDVALLARYASGEMPELQPRYLVRDLLLEELGRALFLASEDGQMDAGFAGSVVHVMAAHLLRSFTAQDENAFQGGLGPARERKIREYIERDLEQDLSVQALAKVVGLSPQHFATLFRTSTGFTPHQYVNHRRMERAQQLLAEESLSMIEIALACGFTSQSQFITVFRRLVGVTPGRFRAARFERN